MQLNKLRIFKRDRVGGWVAFKLLVLVITLIGCLGWFTPALAGLNDDHFDGNIFALYGGNGSLVPPKVTLADSLKRQKPALLVFYVNDSSDCKQFTTTVSQLQAFYGRAADFIPIDVDTLPLKGKYSVNEPGYYYAGVVPQTVLLNQTGQVALNAKGKVSFEQIDDVFRQVFDLLPRSESVTLKRRAVNEINVELAP
uniref:Thioredoxin-like fold domain-containing protein n=1 Tax=Cyanothece sp. (strain PCC 7425 / ATCC 29141) TaxID=395961 RepID=B8HSB5_CYAP4